MELLKSIFSGVLTMSLKAIPVILLVLLLRFALRRAPKRWAYALWAVPLFRLVCPAALPAAFSLYNLSFLPRSTRSGGATGTAADFFNLSSVFLDFFKYLQCSPDRPTDDLGCCLS